jgi:pyruvate/2-oxoglutarate dehydrogenase complex dihydrolipoamide dehydrogenase (E3) component
LTLLTPDICVIGAGSAGLTVAAGASQLGAETVLIEAGAMGGDCLNRGCVPSKALLAAADAAHAAAREARFGVKSAGASVDFRAVHRHVHEVIAAIAPTDSVERYEGLGVRVIPAMARFTGPDEVAADGTRIRARRFVVATGSKPAVPPVPGLDAAPFHTNETIFENDRLPEHLIVIGGGPIGCELAQAHRRLGAAVSVLERATLLPKDDPEAVDVLRRRLRAEGIGLHEEAEIAGIAAAPDGRIEATLAGAAGEERRVVGTMLLVAAGRTPDLAALDLDKAGIAHSPRGITVDRRLRTTNRRVYAIGDVTGGWQFTHVAGYHAGIVIRNALFRLPAKVDERAIPWVTYTDPELAHVGLAEAAAREQAGAIRVLRWPYAENDRARAEGATEGFVKVVTTPRGRILGATIVGASAGELILPWVLAIGRGLPIGALATMVAPYPTLGEIGKRAAGSFYERSLFSERTRRIVRLLRRFG